MSPLSLRALPRGARRRSVLVPLLIAAPVALATLPSATQAAVRTVRTVRIENTFGCGGVGNVVANQWTVPDGVTRATMVVQGERGGSNGGLGAEITTVIDVTPGQTYYVCLGIGGGNGAVGANGQGGDGGGYSSVSRNTDNTAPLVVAAGGGGTGSGPSGGNGGDAGTANTEASSGGASGTAGGGGRPDDNGVGRGGVNSANASANGGAGLVRIGGSGGGVTGGNGGGGGGSGIYGGGGGAGSTTSGAGAGGGAGGFSQCLVGGCTSQNVAGGPYVSFSWEEPTGTSTNLSFVDTTRAISGKSVTLRAVVTPIPTSGTVTFTVDDQNQWNCEDVLVNTVSGIAECVTNVPGERGSHTVRATYSDASNAYAGSSHEVPFQVYGGVPTVSPSPTADFGEVELGKSTTKPFTITNSGDADLTFDRGDGVYISEYMPRTRDPRSTEFTAADDQCSDRTIAPGASCVVVVKFTPSALGARTGTFDVNTDSWEGADFVDLTGVGIAVRPQERQPETPTTPQTPAAPGTPAAQPAPAAPAPAPSKPAESTRAPATPPAIGASSPFSVARGAQVSEAGDMRLPLVCPPGQPCRVSGTLTLAITGGQARASAATKTRVLLRFAGVKIAAGKTKTLSLRLPASFVKAQQAKGVRKLRTTLTVKTTLGNGRTVTRRQAITLLIPRARAAQRAAPQPAQRPAFTG